MIYRWMSFAAGMIFVDFLFHQQYVSALGFGAETMTERLWALTFVSVITLLFFYMTFQFFSASFFHGVLFSSGFFASADIILIHWIFQLHRLTAGPEANLIEPPLVIIGFIMMIYALKKEKKLK